MSAFKHGDRVWALHTGGKKRRAIVVEVTAVDMIVRDAFASETWRVKAADCTPIVDSGEVGEQSSANVREQFASARKHLARARRFIKGEE